MSNVLMPESFNEKFTIYLNADGRPVQRMLREMTAAEVMLAFEWHSSEADRLDQEAEPARGIARALEAGTLDPTRRQEDLKAASAALHRAGEANVKTGRLMQMISALMPAWQHHPKVGVAAALRRWWPGGRAA